MNTTYELNNCQKDSDFQTKVTKQSPVVEIFRAMTNGEELSRFGKVANAAVEHIKNLGVKAEAGDLCAISELNTIRRFAIETPIMKELQLLSVFGTYTPVGFDETVEREIYKPVGETSRVQANAGDVVFPTLVKETYPVPTFTVSGGYAVDYRKVAAGDMSKENIGINKVKTDIRNRAVGAIVNKIYKAIHDATGVKFAAEDSGLVKANVDAVLNKVRRFGKPSVIADYAVLSQFTPWAGYQGTVNSVNIAGLSDDIINEIAKNGLLASYNGAILSEIPNPFDEYALDATGTGFKTLLPQGLGFVVPSGANSPIATFTRGGLTSFTGNNVKNGQVETRFDLEVGVDIAKGQEYKVGMIYDNTIGGIEA